VRPVATCFLGAGSKLAHGRGGMQQLEEFRAEAANFSVSSTQIVHDAFIVIRCVARSIGQPAPLQCDKFSSYSRSPGRWVSCPFVDCFMIISPIASRRTCQAIGCCAACRRPLAAALALMVGLSAPAAAAPHRRSWGGDKYGATILCVGLRWQARKTSAVACGTGKTWEARR
jgi:hypothetical protein